MRILYSHQIRSHDGPRIRLEEQVSALLREGHAVRVVGPDAAAKAERAGALGSLMALADSVPAYLRLRRACDAFRPDLIYASYSPCHLAAGWLARSRGLRYFLEIDAQRSGVLERGGGSRWSRLARSMECRIWRRADRLLVVSGVLRELVMTRLREGGAEPATIDIAPNAVLLDRFLPAPFAPSAAMQAASRPVVLGFVGSARNWPGLDAVIRSITAQRRSITLTLIGGGPDRSRLAHLAAELGLADRVTLTGEVDPLRIPDLVADFDIALQPCATAGESPLTLIDYMAAGRAIVAPDQPNIREILEHGRTALLFDPAAEGALWQAIALLIGDPRLRQRLGEAARAELIARDFTWSANARRIAKLAAERGAMDEGGKPA